jgi:hypothetical protein
MCTFDQCDRCHKGGKPHEAGHGDFVCYPATDESMVPPAPVSGPADVFHSAKHAAVTNRSLFAQLQGQVKQTNRFRSKAHAAIARNTTLEAIFPKEIVSGTKIIKHRNASKDTNKSRKGKKDKEAMELFVFIMTTTAASAANHLGIDLATMSIDFGDGHRIYLADVDCEDEFCPAIETKTLTPEVKERLAQLLSVRDELNISERQLHEVLMVLPEIRGTYEGQMRDEGGAGTLGWLDDIISL